MWINDIFLRNEKDFEFMTGGRMYNTKKAKFLELLNLQKPSEYELYINKKYSYICDEELISIYKKVYAKVIITPHIPKDILYILREVKYERNNILV